MPKHGAGKRLTKGPRSTGQRNTRTMTFPDETPYNKLYRDDADYARRDPVVLQNMMIEGKEPRKPRPRPKR